MELCDLCRMVGRNIKKVRKAKGITQEKLAEIVEVDFRHISAVETGNKTPSFKLINDISNCLHIEIYELFDIPALGHYQKIKQGAENIKFILDMISKDE